MKKKADVNTKNGAGETALMFAGTNGSPAAVGFLLDRGADATIRSKRTETALGNAATAGIEETVRLLLEHGAEVNTRNIRGYSPLMLAASSDAIPTGAVKLLLAAGADRSYVGDYDEKAIDFAVKRGDTEVARLLGASPAKAAPLTPMAAHTSSFDVAAIPGAVEKAMGLLEKQSANFIRIAGCNSCHSQDLASAAAGFVKSRGLKAPTEIPQLPQSMMPSPERLMDLAVVSAPSTAWELVDFGMNNVPPDAYTDAAVRLVKVMQRADGSWTANQGRRPPMAAGEFQDAAVCIYALRHYGPPAEAASTAAVIAKAVTWLEHAKPETTQDRAFQALALAWASENSASAKSAARSLAGLQRADGGWSQFPGMESDAYATGQAIFAMHCFLTKTSPLLVLKRFTIVNCFSVVSLTFSNALSLMTSGTKLALVSEQETSQARQPMHRVVSTSTPTNSLSASVVAALAGLAGSTGMTAVAAVRKKHLLSMLSPDSQARAIS